MSNTWRYIIGSEADFKGAPDWATVKGSVGIHNKTLVAWEGEGIYQYLNVEDLPNTMSGIFMEWNWRNKPKIIAQRERVTDDSGNLAEHMARKAAAVATLEGKGYTWCGGAQWKPPLGKPPAYITDTTRSLIAERGERYGKFAEGAAIMQQLKQVTHCTPGWSRLSDGQKEALDMITHKIGRMLNGDPNYDDNWKDIAGYATLVADELNGVKR